MSLEYWHSIQRSVIKVIIFFALTFVTALLYSKSIYSWIEHPLLQDLPSHHLISTSLTHIATMPLQLSGWVSLFITMPYALYELWRFVAPALTRHEQFKFLGVMILSVMLFILGAGVAYYVILPILFNALLQMAPRSVEVLPDMNLYLNFVGTWTITFGLLAQLPLMMCVLTYLRLFQSRIWFDYRPHAMVLSFVVGMLLTPPDVVSQLLLALPLCGLYQLGCYLAFKCTSENQKA